MITNPEDPFQRRITKGDIAGYYEAIAPDGPAPPQPDDHHERFPAERKPGSSRKVCVERIPGLLERVEVPKKRYRPPRSHRTRRAVDRPTEVHQQDVDARAPALITPDFACRYGSVRRELRVPADARCKCATCGGVGLPSWVKKSGRRVFHIAFTARRQAGDSDVGTSRTRSHV